MMDNYVTLKIPRELANKIDYVIDNHLCGYRSRAELANEGIRLILSSVANNQEKLKGDGDGDKDQS